MTALGETPSLNSSAPEGIVIRTDIDDPTHEIWESCEADRPTDISDQGWLHVLKRLVRSLSHDGMWLRSAGVAYCGLFAAIPGMSVPVSLFGLLANPEAVHHPIEMLGGLVPANATGFLADQMQAIASTSKAQLGGGLGDAVLVALWGAWSGASSLIAALNIAYQETETRHFLRRAWDALVVAVSTGLFLLLAFILIALLPVVLGRLPLGPAMQTVISTARWPALAVLCTVALAMLYRFAPCRRSQVALGKPWRDGCNSFVACWLGGLLVLCLPCPLV